MNENDKLNELYLLNPDKRPHDISEVTTRNENGILLYLLPKWLTGSDKDEYVNGITMGNRLRKLGFTPQIYYDVVILGIRNIEDRPKCNCGKKLKYNTLSAGYYKYCSISCSSTYMDREVKEKISKSLTGRKQSEDTLKKRSESMKGKRNALGYRHTDKAKKSMSNTRRSKEYLKKQSKWLYKCGGYKFNFKRGKVYSVKSGKELTFLSSWEKYFILKCNELDIINYIDSGDSVIIKYVNPIDNEVHSYIPDFKITLSNGRILVIEIKPNFLYNDPVVVAKRNSALIEFSKIGYSYITVTESILFDDKLLIGKFLESLNLNDYPVMGVESSGSK